MLKISLTILIFVAGFISVLPFQFLARLELDNLKALKDTFLKDKLKIFLQKNIKDLFIQIGHSLFAGFVWMYLVSRMLFDTDNLSITNILLLIFFLVIINGLIYLSIYDINFFEVPNKISLILSLLPLIVNLILILSLGLNNSYSLWANHDFFPLANLIAGLGGAFFIFLLVLFTKGKGMGDGDIRVAAILGLMVGQNILIGFYVTIFTACIVSLLYSMKLGKFKNVKIPFVPFIVFGTIITILFSFEIASMFRSFYFI